MAPPRVNRIALIGVGALLILLTNAVVFVLPPLLPVIEAQYHLATIVETTWLYTALTLGGGAGFILLPRVADLHGDRSASVIACAVVTVGALIPAVGDSYATLLVGCAVMGFGGAAQLLPLGFLRRNLGDNGIAAGVAVLVIATGAGIVLGMIGGSLVVEHLSLQAFFVVLTTVFGATTVAAFHAIPHTPPADPPGRISFIGTIGMIGWVAAILLTLTQGLVWGAGALIPLVVGVGGGIFWVRAERGSDSAVFDVSLMTSPMVTAACTCIALFAAVNSAYLLLVSDYAQVVPGQLPSGQAYGLGFSSLDTGWLMVPFAVTFLVGGALADRPVAKGRGASVLTAGAAVCAGGLAWSAIAMTGRGTTSSVPP